MNPLLLQSAVALAGSIRRREVSSREVVLAHVEHLQRHNPALNALVCDRFDAALREADAADARVAAGEDLPPLHGVPCTVKECFALTGMPNTAGLVARKGLVSSGDAAAVRRVRAAGAIPLGVTNVSELCMWMESDNRVYGRTNNPYDVRRIVGGSSGGEGAVVGAGAAPFGIGSDIGGSIRMPAFFNGVFGHKPTGGLISNAGQFPLPAEGSLRYVTTGPLARRAEDLWPLVKILAGRDPDDAGTLDLALGDPAGVRVDGLRVLSVESNGVTPVSRDLVAAQRAAEGALAARGAVVERGTIEGLESSLEIWSAMLDASHGPSFSSMLGNGTPIRAGRELLRWAVGRSPHTLPAIGLALVEKLPALLPGRAGAALALGRALRERLHDRLGPGGVLLYPSYARPAPRHHAPLLPPIHWVYTAIFNVMEMPATQVPLGLNAEGLPLGVQVVSARGNDHVCVAVAMELERALGGWVFPPALHGSRAAVR